jgi:hypothetical protein
MVSHRLLSARILHSVLVSIIQNAVSDAADVTAEITGVMKVSGREPVTIRDSGISRTGLAAIASYLRPAGIVGAVLSNPFEDAEIESLDFDVSLRYDLEYSTIVGAYLTAENPSPGDLVSLNVRMQSYGGNERIMTFPVRIPDVPQGQQVQITVGGGDFVTPVLPVPTNLDDMLANVGRLHPAKSVVVVVGLPDEGMSLRGRVLEQLPDSAVSALKPTMGSDSMSSHKTTVREVYPTSHVVAGTETVNVTVGSRRNK